MHEIFKNPRLNSFMEEFHKMLTKIGKSYLSCIRAYEKFELIYEISIVYRQY